MLAVLGLGNPGEEYVSTRHNVGFEVLDRVASENGETLDRRKFKSLSAEVRIGNQKVLLCKPQTYMNNSGRAARAVLDFFKLEPGSILVVCDDFNLELGRLRARRTGSHGGHNGLDSILRELGTQEFPRLRMGIGSSRGDTVDFVLGRFRKAEQDTVDEMIGRAASAVHCWATEGIEACMNKFNSAPAGRQEDQGQ